jgi:ferric-dicitrate binding protein FerR (iron transport regulator)
MSASPKVEPDEAFCILAERFAAGTLAGSEREEFRRRLEQQPDLERYVTGILSRDAALREIIPIIAKRRDGNLGPSARSRPLSLHTPLPPPPRTASRRTLQLLAWAAPLAAAVVLAIILVERSAARPSAPGAGVALVSGTTLHLGDHEARAVACPDGSRLGLEGGAELAFTEDAQGMHIALRAGAMSADIRPQPAGRPLRISAPQADLTVIGTSFRVATDQGRTRLDVSHGSVRFASRSGDAEFLVAAGEYASAGSGPSATVKGLSHGAVPEGAAVGQLVRAIACGLGTSVVYDGVRYEADRDFEGGRVVPWLQARLPDNPLTAAGRSGTFRYAIPLAAGRYAVTIRLHEPDPHPAPGRRVFTIDVQGERIWKGIDIAAEVGQGPLLDLTSVVEVQQGTLDLRCFAERPVRGDDAGAVIAAILVRRLTP